MSEKPIAVQKESGLARLFPMVKKLFEFAEDNKFDPSSFDSYGASGDAGRADPSRAVALPQEFNSLIAEYPGTYFVVAYENRQDLYYIKGTRERRIRLSTAKTWNETNERLRQIDITELDEIRGNKLEITVRDFVRNADFVRINDGDIPFAHGEARIVYEIDPNGEKHVKENKYNRVDQAAFPWNGVDTEIRWVRNMTAEVRADDKPCAEYKETFLVGLRKEGGANEMVDIKIKVVGPLANPESITLIVGSELVGGTAQTLFAEGNCSVLVYPAIRQPDTQLDILQHDPNYTFLFDGRITTERVVTLAENKMKLLREQWDTQQTIFEQAPQLPNK